MTNRHELCFLAVGVAVAANLPEATPFVTKGHATGLDLELSQQQSALVTRAPFQMLRSNSKAFSSSSSRPNYAAAADHDKLKGPQEQPSRPNGNTYWAVADRLLAGEYPGDARGGEGETRQKLRQYLDSGVTFFLDLTERGEKMDYESILREEVAARGMRDTDVEYRRLPVPDFGVPSDEEMTSILDVIDEAIIHRGRTVYVHCRGGIGRTGTVVGCYLVRNGNNGKEALEEVNRLFQSSGRSRESSYSPETPDQMAFVRNRVK